MPSGAQSPESGLDRCVLASDVPHALDFCGTALLTLRDRDGRGTYLWRDLFALNMRSYLNYVVLYKYLY
jgi:hypothetical protein